MRIWAFSVRRWQFTLVLFGLLIAMGVSSLIGIPRSEDPEFPVPVGVFRSVDFPDYAHAVIDQVVTAQSQKGKGDLAKLLRGAETWTVTPHHKKAAGSNGHG